MSAHKKRSQTHILPRKITHTHNENRNRTFIHTTHTWGHLAIALWLKVGVIFSHNSQRFLSLNMKVLTNSTLKPILLPQRVHHYMVSIQEMKTPRSRRDLTVNNRWQKHGHCQLHSPKNITVIFHKY